VPVQPASGGVGRGGGVGAAAPARGRAVLHHVDRCQHGAA